jgi:hypothetical protein
MTRKTTPSIPHGISVEDQLRFLELDVPMGNLSAADVLERASALVREMKDEVEEEKKN